MLKWAKNVRKEMNRSHSIYDSPWAREFLVDSFYYCIQYNADDGDADSDAEAIITETIEYDTLRHKSKLTKCFS